MWIESEYICNWHESISNCRLCSFVWCLRTYFTHVHRILQYSYTLVIFNALKQVSILRECAKRSSFFSSICAPGTRQKLTKLKYYQGQRSSRMYRFNKRTLANLNRVKREHHLKFHAATESPFITDEPMSIIRYNYRL